jgi:hypothetical protein
MKNGDLKIKYKAHLLALGDKETQRSVFECLTILSLMMFID